MSTASQGPSAMSDVHRAALVFSEIAYTVANIDTLMRYQTGIGDLTPDPYQVEALIHLLHSTLKQVGMLADFGSQQMIGAAEVRGGIAEWLMPPIYEPKGGMERRLGSAAFHVLRARSKL